MSGLCLAGYNDTVVLLSDRRLCGAGSGSTMACDDVQKALMNIIF